MEEMETNSSLEVKKDNVDDNNMPAHYRRIKSYVLREGRLTTGQERALKEQWPNFGIEFEDKLLNLQDVFADPLNPLTVEIGFGMGKSLVEMAIAAPNRNFIGIEVHTPGVGACLASISENNVANLRLCHHDAVEVFEKMLPNNCIDTMQLFFPDPWHKARHHKRRIVKQEFLDMVIPKMKVGGIIHMATDWENYAEQMLEVLSADKRLVNLSENNTYVPRPDSRPLTKFELRGQRLGHGVWDLQFKKI